MAGKLSDTYYGFSDWAKNTMSPEQRKTGLFGAIAGSAGNAAGAVGDAMVSAFGDRRNNIATSNGDILSQRFKGNVGYTEPKPSTASTPAIRGVADAKLMTAHVPGQNIMPKVPTPQIPAPSARIVLAKAQKGAVTYTPQLGNTTDGEVTFPPQDISTPDTPGSDSRFEVLNEGQTPEMIQASEIPSGGGIATMGDQTIILAGRPGAAAETAAQQALAQTQSATPAPASPLGATPLTWQDFQNRGSGDADLDKMFPGRAARFADAAYNAYRTNDLKGTEIANKMQIDTATLPIQQQNADSSMITALTGRTTGLGKLAIDQAKAPSDVAYTRAETEARKTLTEIAKLEAPLNVKYTEAKTKLTLAEAARQQAESSGNAIAIKQAKLELDKQKAESDQVEKALGNLVTMRNTALTALGNNPMLAGKGVDINQKATADAVTSYREILRNVYGGK